MVCLCLNHVHDDIHASILEAWNVVNDSEYPAVAGVRGLSGIFLATGGLGYVFRSDF